ncbi:MAG: hypothetical protein WBE44_20710 [Terriglobales bacterium]|jgi:hypothetical protein
MRVRVNSIYIFHANLLDIVDGRTNLQSGDVVRVVNLPSAPPANTMGQCYVADIKTGAFIGMVSTNSLHTRAEYVAYLRERIAAHEDNPTNKAAIVWQGKANL